MISFATVVDRALTGPICTERDFELGILVPNLRRVIEKYGIKYDPQNPVPTDNDLPSEKRFLFWPDPPRLISTREIRRTFL